MSAILELNGFGVCFGRRVVLSEVDLALPKDGVDVLMGPVKTGKSTLMRSLAGLNDASALYRCWGQALLRSEPVAAGNRPALVQQHARVLNAAVGEALWSQLRLKRRISVEARQNTDVHACLKEHGLDVLLSHATANMLDLPVHWQRALNILAFALTEPGLIFIDEPTYGLDDASAAWLLGWLRGLAERHKLLVSLHHQGQARQLADRIVLLAGGRVLAHCATQTFFMHPPNAWVAQFIRTGSLPIASPGASRDALSADAEQPPPLPQAALSAISAFSAMVAPVSQAAERVTPDALSGVETTMSRPAGNDVQTGAPRRAGGLGARGRPVRETDPARAPRAMLPPVSNWGVEAAATVGRHAPTGQSGPPGFEWILPGRLAGCAEPGLVAPIDYDLDLLAYAGITHLITLTERDLPQDALARHGLRNLHLPIYDREAPSIAQTYMLVYRMQLLLDEGHVLAVHCKAGIGRTGSILAAWLIREGGLTAEAAIQRLRAIKRSYVQTAAQELFLHAFERDILTRQ